MTFCWFAYFYGQDLSGQEKQAFVNLLEGLDGLSRSLVHIRPEHHVVHPFPDDEKPPALALQLYAPALETLENLLTGAGALSALLDEGRFPSLAGAVANQQVMWTRRTAVPNAPAPSAKAASYLVHYPGHAENLPEWLQYYIDHHPQVMTHFPDICEIEIYTRVDWVGDLAIPRVDHMQRNKQVFPDISTLSASLLSPVIGAMRQDFACFPPFTGKNVHYPMNTMEIL